MIRAVIIALSLSIFASETLALTFQNRGYNIRLNYQIEYDDNVFNYSSRDRAKFLDDQDPKPNPITTLDDLRQDFKLTYTHYIRTVRKLDTRFQFTGNVASHVRNPVNNLTWFNASIRQEISEDFRLLLYYFHEPRFYIRNYRDIHSGERLECDFSMDQYLIKAYYRPIKLIELIPSWRYKLYAYNQDFTEYDSDFYQVELEGVVRTGPWRLAVAYGYAINQNIGFDSLGEILYADEANNEEDRDEGEGDYEADHYSLSIRYQTELLEKVASLYFGMDIEDRYYTTNRTPDIDPIHSGRNDFVYRLSSGISLELNSATDLDLAANYKARDSQGLSPILSDVKDYRRFSMSVGFAYKIR